MNTSFSGAVRRLGDVSNAENPVIGATSSRGTGLNPGVNPPANTKAGPALKKNKPSWLQSGGEHKVADFQYTFDIQLDSFCREHGVDMGTMRKELDALFSLRKANVHEIGNISPPKVDLDKPASSDIDIHKELIELLGELNDDIHDLEARRRFIKEKKYLRELDPERNADAPQVDPVRENRLKNAVDYLRNASKTERIGFIYTLTNGAEGVRFEQRDMIGQCGQAAGSRVDMAVSGVESGEFQSANASNLKEKTFKDLVYSLASEHVANSFNSFFDANVSDIENADAYARLKREFYENNGNISPFVNKYGHSVSLHLDAESIFQGVMQKLETNWGKSEEMRQKIIGANELEEGQIERAFYQKSEIFNHVFTHLTAQDGEAFLADSNRLMRNMFLMDSSHILQALKESGLFKEKNSDGSRPASLRMAGCFPVKKLLGQIYGNPQKELSDLASLLLKKLECCIKECTAPSQIMAYLEMCPDACFFHLDSALSQALKKSTLDTSFIGHFVESGSVQKAKLWATSVNFDPSRLSELVFAKVASGHTENLQQIINGLLEEMEKSGKHDPESLRKKLFNHKDTGKRSAFNMHSLKSYLTSKPKKTLLHAAVETHDAATIRQVLSLQPPGWGLDNNGETALHVALASGDRDAALALIEALPVDELNRPNRHGQSPLHQVVYSDEYAQIASALIRRGCAIDQAVREHAEAMNESSYGGHWLLPAIN